MDIDKDEWYTPAPCIAAVQKALGGRIGLDPFSCVEANKTVGADRIFTKEQDAFAQDWTADTVFMNPPYSKGLCAGAVGRFLEEKALRSFKEGIVLVNNATDTKWFYALVCQADAVCFTLGRISFYNTDGKNVSNNPRGQVFVYFGNDVKRFKDAFKDIGYCLQPI